MESHHSHVIKIEYKDGAPLFLFANDASTAYMIIDDIRRSVNNGERLFEYFVPDSYNEQNQFHGDRKTISVENVSDMTVIVKDVSLSDIAWLG